MWRKSKAPKEPKAEPEPVSDAGSIKIQRSDGVHHDLLSVVGSTDISEIISDQIAKDYEERNRGASSLVEDTGNINVPRSDGEHHDLINVFKALSDSRGSSMKLDRQAAGISSRSSSRQPSITAEEAIGFSNQAQAAVQANKVTDTGYYPNSVRIVHMSDTHNFLSRTSKHTFLPEGDILVHTGNFTDFGTEEEFRQFNEWLGTVKGLYHYRIVIFGSRDVKEFGNNWDSMKKLLTNATHIPCHSEVVVLGIRFYGAPWHWGHHSNYKVRIGAPSSTSGRFDDIPEGIQVIVTHGPALDTLDTVSSPGSADLAEAIRRVRPALHLHGHAHGAHGIVPAFGRAPLVVNSALTDPSRTVMFACPHVIKATQITSNPGQGGVSVSAKSALSAPGLMGPNVGYGHWHFALDSLDS